MLGGRLRHPPSGRSNIRRPAIVSRLTCQSPSHAHHTPPPLPRDGRRPHRPVRRARRPRPGQARYRRRPPSARARSPAKQIKNGSVAKADLTKAAVRSLTATPASSVRSAQIVDGQVLAPDLGAGSVGQAPARPRRGDGIQARRGLDRRRFGGERVAADGRHRLVHGQRERRLRPVRRRLRTGARWPRRRPLPTGGSPNLADDVVMVSPPVGLVRLPDPHGQARSRQHDPDRGVLVGAGGRRRSDPTRR